LTELRVDGGAAKNDWLLGFQAGVLGVPVRRPAVVETTALGAAGLAGLATGIWSDGEEFLASQGEATRFTSSMSEDERAALLAAWAEAVRAVKAMAEHRPPL
jgi:glycerol kinase